MVAAAAGDLMTGSSRPALARLARTAAVTVRGRVLVVDARGRVLADSAGRAVRGSPYGDRPEIAAALRGRRTQVRRRSTSLGTDLLATAAPVAGRAGAGRPGGAVRITQSVSAVSAAARRVVVGLVLVGAAVLALALLAGSLLAARLARPLRRLEGAARRVADGELEARARVEGSSEQRWLASTFNDMTSRLGRLVEAQRAFVADASHQLRTPLTGLRLRLEEAGAARSREAARRELDAATVEVDRLGRIVDDLLVLSRAGERERPPEDLDLGAAARAAATRVGPLAAALGVTLDVVVAPGPAPVGRCPRADLERALDALLENALRYGGGGGTVEVVAAPGRVEVHDRGPGIDPGEEEAVFERFRRGRAGRAAAPGTGLGLAIARELARGWGGDATLAPRPGGGVVAALTVPAARPDRDGIDVAEAVAP